MSRKILQVGTNGVLATYGSTYEAATATGLNQSNISKCLNNKLKKTGGYRWVYEDQWVQPVEQPQDRTVWFWSYPALEEQLFEIIVSDYNRSRKRKKTFEQVHHLLPKYLYFPYQLFQTENHQKIINSGEYASITCDSKNNFQNVVNAWYQLGAIELVRDVVETTKEDGTKEYHSREYRLTEKFVKVRKVKVYFDASYGTMIQELIHKNNNLPSCKKKRQKRAVNAPQSLPVQMKVVRHEVPQELDVFGPGFDWSSIPSISKDASPPAIQVDAAGKSIEVVMQPTVLVVEQDDPPAEDTLRLEDQALVEELINYAKDKNNWPSIYKKNWTLDRLKEKAKGRGIFETPRYDKMKHVLEQYSFSRAA